MRIAVIDDEKYSRVELIYQIRQILPQAEIFEADDGVHAIELLEKKSFDILFIDIHLCDMEGTTIASIARRLMPTAKIVFATAYSEYAVQAFELQVNDYILKPFDPQRVRQVLERCVHDLEQSGSAQKSDRLAISNNRQTIFLNVTDICYIETDGAGRGCILHTVPGKAYRDTSSLTDYEKQLGQQGFYRIHKTCLVQLNCIQTIFPWSGNSFALRVRGSEEILPISRDRVKELRKKLRI